ncbi:hypothetical protein V2A60_007185 [Cordyceps javanica]|uniref:Acyl-CoA N-acyltransferase n=1 Tax=Cordyceps javanica TaxID=43265 RepID=A0A545VR97_9HYPO|nr:Acyl-CoA N-acyltransferase [Cordyceps javanica]TQW04260.1 Acyl-CoA N-acyltransferase [Cordyceps javanica]
MSPHHPFRSERLEYRAYHPDKHVDFIEQVHTEPFAYINASASLHRPVGKRFVEDVVKDLVDKSLLFVIIYRIDNDPDTSEPIGAISLSAAEPEMMHHRCSNMAIDIVHDQQGRGYGTEALNWALEWGFRQAGLHRIELEYLEWNSRVRPLYDRCGFTEEGRRRKSVFKDGKWWDEIGMSILEDEWRARWQGSAAIRT